MGRVGHGVFASDKMLKLRHLYISWVQFDPAGLAEQCQLLQRQGLEIVLTVEPWPVAGAQSSVLAGILTGDYDTTIDQIAGVLGRLRGPVYVSWGHEMDQDLTTRYPGPTPTPLNLLPPTAMWSTGFGGKSIPSCSGSGQAS